MAIAGLEKLLELCKSLTLTSCGRLRELVESAHRLPEDLFLQALAGILRDLEEEARDAGASELADLAAEARRDAEWALRESGW